MSRKLPPTYSLRGTICAYDFIQEFGIDHYRRMWGEPPAGREAQEDFWVFPLEGAEPNADDGSVQDAEYTKNLLKLMAEEIESKKADQAKLVEAQPQTRKNPAPILPRSNKPKRREAAVAVDWPFPETSDAPLATPNEAQQPLTPSSDSKIDLDNSIPLDIHRVSDFPEVRDAVSAIYAEFKASDVRGHEKMTKEHIKLVILNLYVCWLSEGVQRAGVREGLLQGLRCWIIYNPPSPLLIRIGDQQLINVRFAPPTADIGWRCQQSPTRSPKLMGQEFGGIRQHCVYGAPYQWVRLDFDRRSRLRFRGAVITSDAGLLAYRELDWRGHLTYGPSSI